MKIVNPNVTEIIDFEGVNNFYKTVARAARICYASDKTTGDRKLVERLIESKHFSPFEHAIITIKDTNFDNETNFIADLVNNIYNNDYTIIPDQKDYIVINGRVIVESIICSKNTNNILNKVIDLLDVALNYFKSIEIDIKSFKSFIVDTSIGCTREINRHHDNFYICEQSTRYCNFCKDKFGKEVSFNKPYWYDGATVTKQNAWEFAMRQAENNYIDNAVGSEFTTDEVRGMLPLDTHSRAIYTATVKEWEHFLDLRLRGTTGKPHGDIQLIAQMISDKI